MRKVTILFANPDEHHTRAYTSIFVDTPPDFVPTLHGGLSIAQFFEYLDIPIAQVMTALPGYIEPLPVSNPDWQTPLHTQTLPMQFPDLQTLANLTRRELSIFVYYRRHGLPPMHLHNATPK